MDFLQGKIWADLWKFNRCFPSRRSLKKQGWVGILISFAVSGCSAATRIAGTPNSLDPKGAAAQEIALIWWIMAGLGAAVFLLVLVLLLYGVYNNTRRSRAENLIVDRNPPEAKNWIWMGGILLPAVVITVVYLVNLRTHAALANVSDTTETVVEVIGHQWWWEVQYPDQGFVTANEIHIPVGEPVQIRLATEDVIHSFWVPELHGKMDMIPGKINSIIIQAEEAGIYRGVCAEFCGDQHAKMQLLVVAEPVEDFRSWVDRESRQAVEPVDAAIQRGRQVFLGSSCVYCHTVRGTNAVATIGPDLTHIASRLTIAAGILDNNPGNLAGWIIDPQHIKPGNLMPPSNLSGEELQAMLNYLQTLE